MYYQAQVFVILDIFLYDLEIGYVSNGFQECRNNFSVK